MVWDLSVYLKIQDLSDPMSLNLMHSMSGGGVRIIPMNVKRLDTPTGLELSVTHVCPFVSGSINLPQASTRSSHTYTSNQMAAR